MQENITYNIERIFLNKCTTEEVIKRIIQAHREQDQERAG